MAFMARQHTFLVAVTSFFRWWRDELAGLLPSPLATPRIDAGRWLVLDLNGENLRLLLERGGEREEIQSWPNDHRNYEHVATVIRKSKSLLRCRLGLRLGLQTCYRRTHSLPPNIGRDITRILELDLERSTPFSSETVLTALDISRDKSKSGETKVVQYIVKRSYVSPALEVLDANGLKVLRIDIWDEKKTTPLPINFLLDPIQLDQSQKKNQRARQMTAALAIILLFCASEIYVARLGSSIEKLEARNAEMRTRISRLREGEKNKRDLIQQRVALIELKNNEVSRAYVIEVLTRLLPDNTYLTDLRIEGRKLDFTGISATTADIIPIIEQSGLFADVKLTSPVTLDRRSGLERFSLTANTDSSARVSGDINRRRDG